MDRARNRSFNRMRDVSCHDYWAWLALIPNTRVRNQSLIKRLNRGFLTHLGLLHPKPEPMRGSLISNQTGIAKIFEKDNRFSIGEMSGGSDVLERERVSYRERIGPTRGRIRVANAK